MTYNFFESFVEKTGLDLDYMNAWTSRALEYPSSMKQFSEEELKKKLSEKIETYEEYHERQYPKFFGKTMFLAKKDLLKKLNETVEEYNNLKFEVKKGPEIFDEYQKRCKKIIMGEPED